MNLPSSSITFSSEFFSQPATAGASGTFRAIASDRVEFAADSAIKLNLLPTVTTTYTINNFPAVQLGGAAIININGFAASFAKIKGIHIRVSAYDPDSASSGTVSVTITDLFNPSDVSHVLGIGDSLAITRKDGIPSAATSAISIVANSPVNLRIEVILIGDVVSGSGT
jgi:hypothetical protein